MRTRHRAVRKRRHTFGHGEHPAILGVDMSGRPFDWLKWEEAVRHYVLEQVGWTVGEPSSVIFGGYGKGGERSHLDLHPVIAIRGADASSLETQVPTLSRHSLFARDQNTCMYCGKEFPVHQLTFDHIIPRSKGGRNMWTNAATSCRRCNTHKSNKTLEESGLVLLAIPYEPNYAESLILRNRAILADQMAFLKARVPNVRKYLY